jgi:segregation and condensation protein A
MKFRVDLDDYRGPLDLLLYLVRRHEVDILHLPISLIAEQFLLHLEVLKELNVDDVGDFLSMASTLVEIKSRMVLPEGDEEGNEYEDPRQDLVQKLLEYKKYRDAARLLEDRARLWQARFPRRADDSLFQGGGESLARQPIREIEIWDLVSAFSRLRQEHDASVNSSIVYDDTPIQVFIQRVHRRVRTDGRVRFSQLYPPGAHRSTLAGVFLAVLELMRHGQLRVEQNELFAEIWVFPGEHMADEPDLTIVGPRERSHPEGDSNPSP